MGLVPAQNSTGGKTALGRITKAGDRYIRTLLVIGATGAIRYAGGGKVPGGGEWLTALLAKKGKGKARLVSVAVANNYQQADTGTKMIHVGKNTKSTIISKGISAGHGQNTYRGLVRIQPAAENSQNYTQCDSLLMGDKCGAHTMPYIEVKNNSSKVGHEASTSKISEDQVYYCRQRGLSSEDAVNLIVNGFCKEVFRKLPMEFAVEAQKLLGVSLEGSVG